MTGKMNYVQMREDELKKEYETNMWWIRMAKVWKVVAEVMVVKRDLDYYQEKFNAIRSQYIRKGRKVGTKIVKAA